MKIVKHVHRKTAVYTEHLRVRITEAQLDMLNRMCKKLGKNKSQIVRQAIDDYYRETFVKNSNESN